MVRFYYLEDHSAIFFPFTNSAMLKSNSKSDFQSLCALPFINSSFRGARVAQ